MRLGASGGVLVAVALGGAAGGIVRALTLAAWPAASATVLLGINVLGSGLMGVVLAFSEPGRRHRMPSRLSLGLMAGFCGALTTFSTFAVQTVQMPLAGAALHLFVSICLWLAAAALGLLAGRRLNPAIENGQNAN